MIACFIEDLVSEVPISKDYLEDHFTKSLGGFLLYPGLLFLFKFPLATLISARWLACLLLIIRSTSWGDCPHSGHTSGMNSLIADGRVCLALYAEVIFHLYWWVVVACSEPDFLWSVLSFLPWGDVGVNHICFSAKFSVLGGALRFLCNDWWLFFICSVVEAFQRVLRC